jgi:hypothetical protein
MATMANTSSVPPKKITPRHHQLAAFKAMGLSNATIEERTGYTQSRISVLLSDPRMADLVVEYRNQFLTGQLADQSQRLTQELGKTIDKVLAWRDDVDPTASLRACDMILARAMPAVSKHVEDRTVRIILEKHEISRIEEADREMEIVNAQIQDPDA